MILLRSALFNAWACILTVVLTLRYGPSVHGRQPAMALAQTWARLSLGALRRLCGIDWVLTGAEHLPRSGAALIAPMHQSAFDTVVWLLLVPECTFVLKRELTRVPVFGRLLLDGGMIPVDRRGGATAMRHLIRGAAATAAQGRQIVIFPEGTRVAPGAPVNLQPGVAALAAHLGLPVIPVVTDSGHYWGRRSFHKRPGTIRIVALPPLPVGLPRPELMARLARAYAQGYAALRSSQPVDNPVNQASPDL